jgi:hypothetical protein
MKYYKIGESYGKLESGQIITTSQEVQYINRQEYETATGDTDNDTHKTVIELIRERYSINDEFSIQRQRDTKPEKFQEYFDYVELCKTQVG